MAKTRHSLISLHYAKQLWETARDDHIPWEVTKHETIACPRLTLTARRCSRRYSTGFNPCELLYETRTYLTGGVALTAELAIPEYGGHTIFHSRLAPGWTAEQFIQRASTLFAKCWREGQVHHWRQQLWDLVQRHGDLSQEEIDQIDAPPDYPEDYASMDREVAQFWYDEIVKLRQIPETKRR